MLDLLTGTDPADPYLWSAALLAHVTLGLGLTGALAAVIDAMDRDNWIDGKGGLAACIVVVVYFLGWEGAVQHYAEGMAGALTDTVAIAAGSVIGLMAWARQGTRLAVAVLAVAAIWAWGALPRIRRRQP